VKRNQVLGVVGAGLVVILVWWFLWYSPQKDDTDKTNAQVAQVKSEQESLQLTLERLRAEQQDLPRSQATRDLLLKLIPNDPQLAQFISSANVAATNSGVDWVSVSPTPPAASTGGGPDVISLQMQVQGTFHTVLDYINRIDDYKTFKRLVIIDGVSISAAGTSSGGTNTPLAAGESPTLTVNLTARMFVNSAGTGATGASGTGGGTTASNGVTSTTPTTAGVTGTTRAGVQ
jgi:Tfp pilus assembly protein PilO